MSFPRYPEYKDSGAEWLGEIPAHWEVRKLTELARLESGHTPSRQHPEYWVEHECVFPWFTLSDIAYLRDLRNHLIQNTSQKISRAGMDNSAARPLPVGTVLLSRTASVGFSGIAGIDLAVSQDFAAWICGPALMPMYLLQCLRAMTQEFNRLMMGSTHQTIYMPDISAFRVPLPPLPEQSRITSVLNAELSKIDALVTEQEHLIELLTEKRQAVISHAVTKGLNSAAPMKDSGVEWLGKVPAHWEVAACGRYIEVVSGYPFSSSNFTDEGVRLLRGINVGVGEIRWEECVCWQRVADDGIDNFAIREGELVLGMDRPIISDGVRVAKISSKDLPCLLVQRVAALRPGSRIIGDYLYRLLSFRDMFEAHFSPETTGVSVPHISAGQIRSFIIPVPPIQEQAEIVAHLESETAKLDALIAEAQRAIELLQERRSALISAAVTGKIDVRPAAQRTTR